MVEEIKNDETAAETMNPAEAEETAATGTPETELAETKPAETEPEEAEGDEANVQWATGKRKTAVAAVRLVKGKGDVIVNGRTLEEYFGSSPLPLVVKQPLAAVDRLSKYNVYANVTGGGIAGQAGALRHGITKALVAIEEDLRHQLKRLGFLTRDPRMKERKKYGQRGARARFQFSKR